MRRKAVIQVMDFGTPKVRRCLERLERGLDPFEEEGGDLDEGSDYTAHVKFLHAPQRIDHPAFCEPILTCLPYIQSTLLLKEPFKVPTLPFSLPRGVEEDAWKAVRDKGDGRERFTAGTLWEREYLYAGCIAGAQVRLYFALLMMIIKRVRRIMGI